MRSLYIFAFTAPLLTVAAPTASLTNDAMLGYWNVTDFSYTCTTSKAPCFWDFYATAGPSFQHHPEIKQKVHCTGNTTEKEFNPGSCTDTPKKNIHINAYVGTSKKAGTRLYMQYVNVPRKKNGFFWFYMGNATVTDASSQPKDFQVEVSSAAASG